MKPIVHVGKKFSGAPVPGLYFIQHQQQMVSLAQLFCQVQKRCIQRFHAAFALDGLHQDRAHIRLRQCRFQFFLISRGDIAESLRKWPKVLMKNFLACGGQGGNGAPMETVFKRYDYMPAAVLLAPFPGNL